MKYLSIILIILISSCGYGQYPDTRYKGNDVIKDSIVIFNHNVDELTIEKWEKEDAGFYKGNDVHPLTIGDGGPLPVTVVTYPSTAFTHAREEKEFEKFNEGFVYVGIGQNPDTVYFYWKKYLFYSHQKDIELDKIRKQRNPSYKEYDRLMDSVVRYKKLIDKLNK